MSTTKHREVARLDRVPLPVEAARICATGWQITRTGARVVTKLAGRGSTPAEGHQADPADVRRSGTHLRQVRPDHRLQPGRFRRVDVAGVPQPARRRPARRHRRSAQAVQGGTRRRPVRAFRLVRRRAVRFGVDRAGALRNAAQRRGRRRQDPTARHPPPSRRRSADSQAVRAGRRAGQAGSTAVGPGRRRRLCRQPGRGARLPPGSAVDGCLGLAHARLAAGQKHPRAAGVLGPHHSEGADDGAGARHPHRRRGGHPQGRLRRHRAGQGAAVQRVRGRAAPRPVPWRPARRQPVCRRPGPHRVLRLRHHGPHRSAHPLAAARAGVRAAGQEGPRRGRQDRRADGRRRHRQARGHRRPRTWKRSPPR